MAMKPCAECGVQVSAQADACPQCGSPIKRERERVATGVFIVGLLASVATCSGGASSGVWLTILLLAAAVALYVYRRA